MRLTKCDMLRQIFQSSFFLFAVILRPFIHPSIWSSVRPFVGLLVCLLLF